MGEHQPDIASGTITKLAIKYKNESMNIKDESEKSVWYLKF